MAEGGDAKRATKPIRDFVEIIDHPLVFALAITLMVIPIMALLTGLFKWAGMPGPAALVQHP